MAEFVDELRSKKAFYSLKGVPEAAVNEAEKKLGLKFSREFTDYLLTYGVASVFGQELTGICTSSRLNVVDVTLNERQQNPSIAQQLYVVENTNMDGIIVWQDASSAVFKTAPGVEAKKVSNSLGEYYSDK